MKPAAIILSVLWIASPVLSSGTTDLTKIVRSIAKEPKYQTEPYYALVVFGPKAEKRVWLVVDGEVLYVDRNGNGDLTEANERVTLKSKRIYEPGTYYAMYKGMNSFDIGEVAGLRLWLDFSVRDKDYVPKTDYDKKRLKDHQENGWEFATLYPHRMSVTFTRRPQDAQVWHYNGPLTFDQVDKVLVRGSDYDFRVRGCNNNFRVYIGTRGLPARNSDDRVFVSLGTNDVPAKVHPVADFEFPHKDATKPPIKLQVVLDERC